ncbi:MAG: hypothetical protein AB7O97_03085 [Planctomycetota bacterium]
MELAAILSSIFSFALIKGMLDHRAKERTERMKLLEQALANPAVDRATLQSLAHQLTGVKPKSNEPGRGRGMAWLLALGWLTLFSGLGVWVLGEMIASSDVSASGVLTSLVGFGLVTYPFALRELESRRPTA